ncbi:MAG: class I tRNA ligase family protein [Planctomycetes bacterium]|nr:class I tRNA ligase family protein [Planctomycetota bacterium]
MDVQRRNHKLMHRLEKKHKGKNILLVGHEAPLTLLQTQLAGMSREETIQFRSKGKIKTGELRMVSFADFPVNEDMEIDLHRPYVDKVQFACAECKDGVMERIKEVVDVWFDSGVASWAVLDYPKNKKNFSKLWPSDFNIEGTDQIRGWWNSELILSVIVFDKKPFDTIYMHGMVLDIQSDMNNYER